MAEKPPKPPKPTDRKAAPRFKRSIVTALKPWERPPIPERGDPDIHVIYAAIGLALSRWEQLEWHLASLFSSFIGLQQDSAAAHRAYGAIMVSSERRAMLRAAAEAYFDEFPNPGVEKEFKEIMNVAENLSSRRNDIAHGIVQPYGLFFALTEGEEDSFCLFPAPSSTKSTELAKPRVKPKYAFTAAAITDFGIQFMNLVGRLASLSWKIMMRQHRSKNLDG